MGKKIDYAYLECSIAILETLIVIEAASGKPVTEKTFTDRFGNTITRWFDEFGRFAGGAKQSVEENITIPSNLTKYVLKWKSQIMNRNLL
jgi:hypothetical protein